MASSTSPIVRDIAARLDRLQQQLARLDVASSPASTRSTPADAGLRPGARLPTPQAGRTPVTAPRSVRTPVFSTPPILSLDAVQSGQRTINGSPSMAPYSARLHSPPTATPLGMAEWAEQRAALLRERHDLRRSIASLAQQVGALTTTVATLQREGSRGRKEEHEPEQDRSEHSEGGERSGSKAAPESSRGDE